MLYLSLREENNVLRDMHQIAYTATQLQFLTTIVLNTVVEKTLRPHVKLKTFNFTKKR